MTRLEILTDLLSKKVERQTTLKHRNQQLIELDEELQSAQFGRWFGNSYHKLKRLILLSIGVVSFIVYGATLVFSDDYIQDEEFRKMTLEEKLDDIEQLTGLTIESQSNARIEKYLDEELAEELDAIQYMFLFIGVVFLYAGRLAGKVVKRNRKISEAESVSQEVIQLFQDTIEEEEDELIVLNDLIRKNMSFNHVNS